MRRALAVIVAMGCGAPEPHKPAEPAQPAPTALPAEVARLVERWTMCWHFSGEEPYDAERKQQLVDAVAEWCPGNDDERARLQLKWRADARVQEALRKLDEMR